MTAPRNPDRLIRAFLDEGQTELPDQDYDAVRNQIEQTHQRPVIGPWRAPDMNKFIGIGLAAAAVVVIAFIGYQLVSGPSVVGPGPTETPQASSTPAFSPAGAPALPEGSLVPGTYSLAPAGATSPRIAFTVPDGWLGVPPWGINRSCPDPPLGGPCRADPPNGAGITFWGGDMYVYGDPCHWSTTQPSELLGPTADDFVSAIAAQAGEDASIPADIIVGGFAGKAIELKAPDGLAYDGEIGWVDCDGRGDFRRWRDEIGELYGGPYAPGMRELLWIVDVNGARVVIFASTYEGTSADDRAALQAILESFRFE